MIQNLGKALKINNLKVNKDDKVKFSLNGLKIARLFMMKPEEKIAWIVLFAIKRWYYWVSDITCKTTNDIKITAAFDKFSWNVCIEMLSLVEKAH